MYINAENNKNFTFNINVSICSYYYYLNFYISNEMEYYKISISFFFCFGYKIYGAKLTPISCLHQILFSE